MGVLGPLPCLRVWLPLWLPQTYACVARMTNGMEEDPHKRHTPLAPSAVLNLTLSLPVTLILGETRAGRADELLNEAPRVEGGPTGEKPHAAHGGPGGHPNGQREQV